MKLQKKIIKKRTQNKRNCNNKNDDQIKKNTIKWLGIKLKNKIQ